MTPKEKTYTEWIKGCVGKSWNGKIIDMALKEQAKQIFKDINKTIPEMGISQYKINELKKKWLGD